MRAFLAIPIPGEVQQLLAVEAANFPKLRPVRAEQMHLTLRFLGDLPHRTLRAAMDALGPVVAAQAPFDIAVERVGCFPDRKRAVVVWAGLAAGELQAAALVHGIADALAGIGIERDPRPWTGHVTLGRFRKPTRVAGKSLDSEARFGKFRAAEVVLYTSEIRPEGPIHSPMHRMPLAQTHT